MRQSTEKNAVEHGSRPQPWRRAAIVVVVLAVALILGRRYGSHLPLLLGRVRELGPWAPLVYVAVFVVAVVALVPAWILTVVGGALFGLWPGVPLALASATIGALASVVISRYAARNLLLRRFSHSPRFHALDEAVAVHGRKIVFLLRLSPVVPYNVLNYALGVTRVRLLDVFIASAGMLPATTVYVYAGQVAGEAAAASGRASLQRNGWYYLALVAGLAATIAGTAVVARIARRALRTAVPAD